MANFINMNMSTNPPIITELARNLRQERLFVNSEKKLLQGLNESVSSAGRRLAQSAWTAYMQKENLDGLVLSRTESSPHVCCQRSNLLFQAQFVDAYKSLSHHMVTYSEFLVTLRHRPTLMAVCLAVGDKSAKQCNMPNIVDAVFSGLLGSSLLPEDEKLLLELLTKLIDIQVISAANPRKLLRHGTISFSRMYKAYSDQLFSARIFLTSALYDPILQLLTDDEIFLDIDSSKTLIRFPPAERLRKFGPPGTEDYEKKVKKHRKFIVAKLAGHAKSFIEGIRNSFSNFPGAIGKLMKYLFRKMSESDNVESKDAYAVCVDILFTLFICPAIVDPEPMGIIDMPISYIARFNLMQVAQIIQVLALRKWEEIGTQFNDLYSEFDNLSLSCLIEKILEGYEDEAGDSLDPGNTTSRLSILMTADQLHELVEWLRSLLISKSLDQDAEEEIKKLLAPLPVTVPGRKKALTRVENPTVADGEELDDSNGSPASFAKHKAALTARLSGVGAKSRQSLKCSPDNLSVNKLSTSAPDKVLVIPIHDSPSDMPGLASEENVIANSSSTSTKSKLSFVGFEEDRTLRDNNTFAPVEVLEKRTRFSLSHDEGSIGNTSDNLEAISEAASNHSVASSLEDEVDQVEDPIIDNLSDMVSANVSGRGTPNVSGRDTPSSQVTEGDEQGQQGVVEPPVAPVVDLIEEAQGNNNVLSSRKNGEPDMEERFGRFEIKPELRRGRAGQVGFTIGAGDRDEAVSMVSDTWSTDVLSSDTETVSEPPTLEDLLRGRPGDEFNPRVRMLDQLAVPNQEGSGNAGNSSAPSMGSGNNLLDVTETGSEAWSMDVLASDSESFRLRDFDLEDSLSVARSDDTRFTDDTTRSDPDHMMQRLELNELLDSQSSRGGADQRFIPVAKPDVEQWADQSRNQSARNSRDKRRGSDGSAHSNKHESILKKPTPQPAGAGGAEANLINLEEPVTDSRHSVDSYPLHPPEMGNATSVRLSTTSIASSGSSHGSVGSVEVLVTQVKSRSNSSASVSTSAGGSALEADQRMSSLPNSGAIPKSISFDKTADKDDDGENKLGHLKRDRNFFKNWKLPKIGRSRGGGRGSKGDDFLRSSDRLTHDAFNIPEHAEGPVFRRIPSDEAKPLVSAQFETSDDILAKYRKSSSHSKDEDSPGLVLKQDSESVPDGVRESADFANMESSYIFQDAKRKLRLVLSEADLPVLLSLPKPNQASGGNEGGKTMNEILTLLRVMLAQALNQQDKNLVAQLRETIRCVSLLNEDSSLKLVGSLRDDYRRRSSYIAYLIKSRQGLLSSLNTLQRLTSRMESEQRKISKFLIYVCVRIFLEKQETEMHEFLNQFNTTSVMDEKADLVGKFLDSLWEKLEMDLMLAATNEEQREEARVAVERAIFSQIYMLSLHPNQEADVYRDQVLQKHIFKLKEVITPDHKDLKIPKRFQYECPWPSAQAELRRLAAYKLPSDKVGCVARVSSTIMNLLSLAADKSVPAADDFLPVLVFVIIQANPPSLLSTVQFVDNFYGSRLSGEEQYWWMQFVAAIEFIKTMDYHGS